MLTGNPLVHRPIIFQLQTLPTNQILHLIKPRRNISKLTRRSIDRQVTKPVWKTTRETLTTIITQLIDKVLGVLEAPGVLVAHVVQEAPAQKEARDLNVDKNPGRSAERTCRGFK